jgi:predicted PurR-regulated permease PerM
MTKERKKLGRKSIARIFFYILFLGLLLLMWMMLRPIIHSFLFGAIIAGSFYPFFSRLSKIRVFTRNGASIIATLLIVLIVFIPSIFIIFALSKESLALYNNAREFFQSESFTSLFTPDNRLYAMVSAALSDAGIETDLNVIRADLITYAQQFSGYILNMVNSWISNIIDFLFSFVIMILVIYTLFSRGEALKSFIFKLSPLPDEEEELLLKNFNQMNHVTIVCNGAGGLIQGILAGAGFWAAGIPSVILWTVVMSVLAFIPLLGISIVYVPAVIYLAVIGKTAEAVILFIYCTAVALIVENWFKPWFIGQRVKINSLFILFCIIGGLAYFGVAGIFYGPIIGITFLTLVQLYHERYLES